MSSGADVPDMRGNKKLIAGIVAFATTVSYALYRRHGDERPDESVAETETPVA